MMQRRFIPGQWLDFLHGLYDRIWHIYARVIGNVQE
jgi:hypothetical protein